MIEVDDIFDYQTPFLLNAILDSEHKSRRLGVGSDFYKKSNFLADPNPARIDLAATLTDPFESIYVKNFRQRSKLQVISLMDGSDSISSALQIQVMMKLEQVISKSVAAKNDQYQRYLVSNNLLTIHSNAEIERDFNSRENSQEFDTAQAIDKLAHILPSQTSLVFLISDFHWSTARLNQTMTTLSDHYVVPIILWRSHDYLADYPLWRFINTQDAESGQSTLIFVTPNQKQQIIQQHKDRNAFLAHLFQRHQRRPLWVSDEVNIHDLRAYFHGA
jgi:hypothetical protein